MHLFCLYIMRFIVRPQQLGMLTKLESSIFLSSNSLCGDLPTELNQLMSTPVIFNNAIGTNCTGRPSPEPTLPTMSPTLQPSLLPTYLPTEAPTDGTDKPSAAPTEPPTYLPTYAPTYQRTAVPTSVPTTRPLLKSSGEIRALEALYSSAVTSVPFFLSGWTNQSDPCTEFYGVSCSDGRIVSLDLEALSMAGTLPVSVGSPSI